VYPNPDKEYEKRDEIVLLSEIVVYFSYWQATANVSVFESALGSKKFISLKGGKDSYEP